MIRDRVVRGAVHPVLLFAVQGSYWNKASNSSPSTPLCGVPRPTRFSYGSVRDSCYSALLLSNMWPNYRIERHERDQLLSRGVSVRAAQAER